MLTIRSAVPHALKRVHSLNSRSCRSISSTASLLDPSLPQNPDHVDSQPGLVSEPDATPRKVRKTVTKYKYEDLPKVYVLPDGTVAKPLGEWTSTCASRSVCLDQVYK
jgi:hypothetical protein